MSLKLAASFSYMPASLGHCGTKSHTTAMAGYLATGRNETEVLEGMNGLKAHYFHLRMLALANKREPFDTEVVEAVWTGNELLEPWFAKKASHVPFHLHHVLKFRSFSGRANKTVEEQDRCRISWGRVLGHVGKAVKVKSGTLRQENGRYYLSAPEEKTWLLEYNGVRTAGKLKTGDWVCSHWEFVVKKLSPKEKQNLESYSMKTIEKVNGKLIGNGKKCRTN